jgi:hypothetical protein
MYLLNVISIRIHLRLSAFICGCSLFALHASAVFASADSGGNAVRSSGESPAPPTQTWVVLNDNGGWCWYQDERAVLDDNCLIVGSVANSAGTGGAARGGNIEVTQYDIAIGGPPAVSVLNPNLQNDDHDVPALIRLLDGRYLAAYARHGNDNLIRFRISTHAGDARAWAPEFTRTRPAGVTYNNLMRLAAENNGNGRLFDFYRGEGFDPNFMVSDDDGRNWTYGGRLLYNAANDNATRPYLKYASNDLDTIHFINTEAHPAQAGFTSIYHGYIQGLKAYRSDGTPIGDLQAGPIEATTPTLVFQGSAAAGDAWTTDLQLDAAGRPYIGFSVHRTDDDHRYHYARWDGSQWVDHEIAYAGQRLYPVERHYTGLIALDPQNPDRVFISTNANPVTGQPLVSAADGLRHWELYRGVTSDGGATWSWTPLTANSTADNLRPIVPIATGRYQALLWMRGQYTTYTNYDLDIVGTFFVSADFDLDRDVDFVDLNALTDCSTGANVHYSPASLPPGCSLPINRAGRIPADFDADFDVDQHDFGVLQRCLSARGTPAVPGCMH